jgi:hypothetical protein
MGRQAGSRSPSSPPPSFTHYPSPPRSLVRDGQTSPHRPRLVVSRSTCPPLSPPPPREQLCNRYCSNKHTHRLVHTGLGSSSLARSTCPPLSPSPHANSFVIGTAVINRESVLFIGTRFSNLYTAVDTPARGRVVVCWVFVCLVFVCKYVLGHSRVFQPLNLRLCLLRHLGFLTSHCASPTCRRRRLNSYRLLRRPQPDPPPIPWAHLLHLPASPRPPLYTSTMTT